MFHFPATPPPALYIQAGATGHQAGQVTPFGNPGITVQLATPPGISQPHTSFIGHPAPRHPPCALHNLTNTAKSDRNKDTHAHYTNLKQHTSHTKPTTTSDGIDVTRLRDVLPQNPNRVRDPKSPPRSRKIQTETIGSQGWERASLVQTTCSRHTIQNIQSIHTR
jgi:hypothetical protein